MRCNLAEPLPHRMADDETVFLRQFLQRAIHDRRAIAFGWRPIAIRRPLDDGHRDQRDQKEIERQRGEKDRAEPAALRLVVHVAHCIHSSGQAVSASAKATSRSPVSISTEAALAADIPITDTSETEPSATPSMMDAASAP